jgi:hypothetical protein
MFLMLDKSDCMNLKLIQKLGKLPKIISVVLIATLVAKDVYPSSMPY